MPEKVPEKAFSHLLEQLQQHQPDSLLVAGDQPPPVVENWGHQQHIPLTRLDSRDSFSAVTDNHAFAVVSDYLEHLDKKTGIQRLGQIRNLYSTRVWLKVDDHCGWHFNDFIGLGFRHLSAISEPGDFHCYGYDLGSYNKVRSWNNPRFWANPENFHKYRW